MIDWIQQLDWQILEQINTLRSPVMTAIMRFVSMLGNSGTVWIIICLLMLIRKKTRLAGITALALMIVCAVTNDAILKPLIARPRPFSANPEWIALSTERSFSFPSGHSSNAAVTAFTYARFFRWKALPFILLALLIAFSRLYLGVHYPSDVAAGIAEGIVFSLLSGVVSKWIEGINPKLFN